MLIFKKNEHMVTILTLERRKFWQYDYYRIKKFSESMKSLFIANECTMYPILVEKFVEELFAKNGANVYLSFSVEEGIIITEIGHLFETNNQIKEFKEDLFLKPSQGNNIPELCSLASSQGFITTEFSRGSRKGLIIGAPRRKGRILNGKVIVNLWRNSGLYNKWQPEKMPSNIKFEIWKEKNLS